VVQLIPVATFWLPQTLLEHDRIVQAPPPGQSAAVVQPPVPVVVLLVLLVLVVVMPPVLVELPVVVMPPVLAPPVPLPPPKLSPSDSMKQPLGDARTTATAAAITPPASIVCRRP
jgi:hypothetical protein